MEPACRTCDYIDTIFWTYSIHLCFCWYNTRDNKVSISRIAVYRIYGETKDSNKLLKYSNEKIKTLARLNLQSPNPLSEITDSSKSTRAGKHANMMCITTQTYSLCCLQIFCKRKGGKEKESSLIHPYTCRQFYFQPLEQTLKLNPWWNIDVLMTL